MRLLGSEILSVPFRADFKTGRVSAELLGSSGGNVLLSQLVSPFNLFLRQDSYSNFNCKKHLLSTYAAGLSQVMCGGPGFIRCGPRQVAWNSIHSLCT